MNIMSTINVRVLYVDLTEAKFSKIIRSKKKKIHKTFQGRKRRLRLLESNL